MRQNLSGLAIIVSLVTALIGQWSLAQDGPDRPVVPGPPKQPTPLSRPSTWPGGGRIEASPWPAPQTPPAVEMKPCQGTRILVRVGSEVILESEVAGAVNEVLEANKDRIPPGQWDAQRELLIKQRLKPLIQTKLIYLDAKRTIPAEGWPQIKKQLATHFEEVELEKMVKRAEVGSARELDQKLRSLGTSLDQEKRAFIERTLAQQWIRQQVKRDEEITYDRMVAYYHRHQDEFTRPARARWEELMVRYSKHPDKAAAYRTIARMGNQVFTGVPFAQVAKTGSDGIEAADGGRRDWTTKGSLVCEELDRALFGLPVGKLSPIIEGPKGFHIIRVTEREEAVVAPFLEAQVHIREEIIKQRSEKQLREYLAKLEARTPVWTIFDGDLSNPQFATPRQPLQR